jgi:hypothetical protein
MATHRLPTPGSDSGSWGDILNDFLVQAHNSDGSLQDGIITDAKVSSSAAIAKTKLASSVQTSLTAADNAAPKPSAGTDGKVVQWNNTNGQLVDATTTLNATYARRYASKTLPSPQLVNQVMSSPPTVGAVTTTTGLSGTILRWAAATPVATGQLGIITGEHFTYSGVGGIQSLGTLSPDFNYVRWTSLTNPTTSAAAAVFASANVHFIHDGTQFEVRMKQVSGGTFKIRVNGQLVSKTATPISTSAGSDGYVLVTFSSRDVRKITIEGATVWGGVVTPVADSITRGEVKGPRCLIMADSFGEGANGVGAHSSFIRTFGEIMGWPDTWNDGVGGTGYLNDGHPTYPARVKFRDRLANDVYLFSPDIIIWTGGHNDTSFSQSAVQAEALACYQAVQANLPNCLQIVTSPLWGPGCRTFSSALLGVRDGIKAAAAAAGLTFLDALQAPLDTTPISTTISSTAGSGATSMSLATIIPVGSTIDINNRTEFNRITAVSGVGPYTHTLQFALSAQRVSGLTVAQVGGSLWTGTGTGAATASDGNSDFLVSNDGVHPTQEGQDTIAWWLAANVVKYALPTA